MDDDDFLKALKIMTDAKFSSGKYRLNVVERKKIKEARRQYRKGEVFSNDQVFKEVEEWLKK